MKLSGDELRQRALELMAACGINKTQAAALTPSVSQSAIYKFFDGTLDTPVVEEKVRELVALLERTGGGVARPPVISIESGRPNARRPRLKQRPVYDIRSTRDIETSIDYAVEHQAIVLITADYGVGKTRAVDVWRAKNPGVPSVVVEFDGWTDTAKLNFIARLAAALGMGETVLSSAQGGLVFGRVIERLREEPTVLIFDQCETVRVEILHLIRQIWDKTREYGVAVVLLSGPPLYERLKLRQVKGLGALTSRISAWPVILGPGRDEVAGILAAEGYFVEGAGQQKAPGVAVTEAAFDVWFSAVRGSMRLLLESIDLMSRATGKRLGQQAVAKALETLTGKRFGVAPGVSREQGAGRADEAEEVTA